MKLKIVKPATLTISAGQTVEVNDTEAKRAIAIGLAEEAKETKTKRAAK